MKTKDYGYIRVKLDELLKQRKLSKNKLAHRAEMQRTHINHYCRNEISRLDIVVLARICSTLDCRIEDLLEYIPSTNKDE